MTIMLPLVLVLGSPEPDTMSDLDRSGFSGVRQEGINLLAAIQYLDVHG